MAVTYDVGAIRQFLLNDPDVAAIAGTKVFGNEVPESENATMPKAVVLINSAGHGRVNANYIPVNNTIKDIRCYGKTPYESNMLFMVVAHALKQLRRTVVTQNGLPDTILYSAMLVSGQFSAREPDTEWPVSWGSFEILVSEEG